MTTDNVIIFPDVEALVRAVLNTEYAARSGFTELRANTKVPNPRPDEFVRVERAGGPRETLVTDQAHVILEYWAQTEARAVEVGQLSRGILNAQYGEIFGVTEIGGLINLPDPTTSQTRYTQLFGVRTRGA